MNRRTSNYTLTVWTYSENTATVLDLMLDVMNTLHVTATNSRRYPDAIAVSYRAADDEAAWATALMLLDHLPMTTAVRESQIHTGLGVHSRTVPVA